MMYRCQLETGIPGKDNSYNTCSYAGLFVLLLAVIATKQPGHLSTIALATHIPTV